MSTTTAQLLVASPPTSTVVKSATVFLDGEDEENDSRSKDSRKRPDSLPASGTSTTISQTSLLKRSYPPSPKDHIDCLVTKLPLLTTSPSPINHEYFDFFKPPPIPQVPVGSIGTPSLSPTTSTPSHVQYGALENPDVEDVSFFA